MATKATKVSGAKTAGAAALAAIIIKILNSIAPEFATADMALAIGAFIRFLFTYLKHK